MGNTRSKWRLREGSRILLRGACPSESFPDTFVLSSVRASEEGSIARIVLASVCDEALCERACQNLTAAFNIPVERVVATACCARVTCAYREPAALGVDRWLAVLAAHAGRSSEAAGCMVVSCGTAITMDFVRADGMHEGGYILPGLHMMREMLLSKTGRIRFVAGDFDMQRSPGDSSVSAVQNGIVHAVLSTIERSRTDCEKRWAGASELWCTGGDAARLCAVLERPGHYVEDLVLDGLRYAIQD